MAQPATETKIPENETTAETPAAAVAPPTMEDFVPVPMEEIVTQDVIESIVKGVDTDLELVDFTAVPGTEIGDNYMSVMYAVDIEAKSRKTSETQKIRTMLKTMPRHPMRQQMIVEFQAFVREQKMYDEILPAFLKFQKQHGISDQELFTQYPKCYSTFCDGKSDYLALENLRFSGFRMADRHTGLDFDHCSLILKSLAKLHAISFALYNGSYTAMLEAYPYLEEKLYLPLEKVTDMMKGFMQQSIAKEAETVRNAGFEHEATLLEVLGKDQHFNELHRIAGSFVKYAVVGHGDCWTNNFLFKYSEDGKPTDVKLLDFQISRVSSRTIDLGYFLHTSPQINIINKRIEELLEIYHNEFTRFAKKLGYENSELTFNQLLEEWADRRYFGISSGVLLAPAISAKQENVVDLETMPTEMTETSIGDFMGDMMKNNDILTKKLVNLAKNHLATVPYVQNQLKNPQ